MSDKINKEYSDDIHAQIRREVINNSNNNINDTTDEETKNSSSKYILKILIGVSLLIIIILMVVPYYAIKLNPEPDSIPELNEVMPPDITNYIINSTIQFDKHNIFKNVVPNNPILKQISSKIATSSCDASSKICYSKAIYYFVRDNIKYVSDPDSDYIEHPLEVLYSGGADCDGMAVLLATLEEAIGINAGFVFVPNHVYVQIYVPEAPSKYKEEGWINLDPTCKECEFGEIPISSEKAKKEFVKNI